MDRSIGLPARLLAGVVFASLLATSASGCASARKWKARDYYSYAPDEHPGTGYLSVVAERFGQLAATSRADTASANAVQRTTNATAFLESGMTLTDLLCLDGFAREVAMRKHTQFTRSFLNDTNGLVATILGLTKAGSLATGAVGAGFSYAGSTVEGFEEHYMVAVDLPSAQGLVQRAMAAQAAELTANPPTGYDEAERQLVRYATTCTFGGVRSLLTQSVRTSQPESTSQGLVSIAEAAPQAVRDARSRVEEATATRVVADEAAAEAAAAATAAESARAAADAAAREAARRAQEAADAMRADDAGG